MADSKTEQPELVISNANLNPILRISSRAHTNYVFALPPEQGAMPFNLADYVVELGRQIHDMRLEIMQLQDEVKRLRADSVDGTTD